MSKKYITTDKHPELKEGIIIESEDNGFELQLVFHNAKTKNETGKECDIISTSCQYLLYKGYIKEIQEPKWTDDDMIEFAMNFSIRVTEKDLEEFKQAKA